MESRYYSHWHLAKDESELRLTEFEYASIRFQESFARWITTIAEMSGVPELKQTEHIILHVIRMQNRPKTTTTIARLINRADLPNIQYSLRKLESAGLIRKTKEKGTRIFTYSITELGEQQTNEYAKLRSELLVKNLRTLADFEHRLEDATQLLSVMTGIYEESARNSASFGRDPAG
jgi:predicted MarR family transcription regulator